jgi:hypothetical protein
MAPPDRVTESNATAGEWKALLAPMLTTVGSAEELRGYIVIGVSRDDFVELRTNFPDDALAVILRMVMPGARS